jgi:hypothetical protein
VIEVHENWENYNRNNKKWLMLKIIFKIRINKYKIYTIKLWIEKGKIFYINKSFSKYLFNN